MGAVVCVLNESLTESIKGFYKLRKAYITLDSILAAETEYVRKRDAASAKTSDSSIKASEKSSDETSNIESKVESSTSEPDISEPTPSRNHDFEHAEPAQVSRSKVNETDEFVDADEVHENLPTPSVYMGHVEVAEDGTHDSKQTEVAQEIYPESSDEPTLGMSFPDDINRAMTNMTVQEGPAADLFTEHTVDMFIHSCSNLCFGVLQLMISLIPPAFSTLLKIIGFRGDRERGINMLWQASKFPNTFGAMAGLVLFGYYNGLIGFCDIIPEQGQGSVPRERCKALLVKMRHHYPNSQLWQLEEARMLVSEKQLEKGVEAISTSKESDLRQVVALQWFERSLLNMCLHDYEQTSKCFQKVCATR